ncbi:hypothetical protein H696_06182, partial [Fonticula alba]
LKLLRPGRHHIQRQALPNHPPASPVSASHPSQSGMEQAADHGSRSMLIREALARATRALLTFGPDCTVPHLPSPPQHSPLILEPACRPPCRVRLCKPCSRCENTSRTPGGETRPPVRPMVTLPPWAATA